MWVLARVTGPHASEKYMAQFFLELNTVSSGPYFIIALENTEGTDCIWPRFVYQQWRMHYKISNGTFWVLQIVSDENHWRRELKLQVWTWKARRFICVITDNAGKWWCKRWLRLRASSYLNGSSDQEEASNTRPFNYRSWSMHVKHGDAMLDHGIWEMRWCANGHCIGMPLLTEKSLDLSHLPLSFLWTYTCNDVHLFSLCTFIPSPTFSQPGSMNRSWTVRTSS